MKLIFEETVESGYIAIVRDGLDLGAFLLKEKDHHRYWIFAPDAFNIGLSDSEFELSNPDFCSITQDELEQIIKYLRKLNKQLERA